MVAPRSLSSYVADIPPEVSNSLKKGFSALSSLPIEQRVEITDKVISVSLNGRSTINLRDFVSGYPLDLSQARDVMNAVSSVITLLSDTDEQADVFLDTTKDKIYHADDLETVKDLVSSVISKKSQLKRSLDLASVASETLPSLKHFLCTVDLRPSFEDDKITDATPVAIIHLSTDTTQEVWVQLSASDIRFIQGILDSSLKKMQSVENMYRLAVGAER